MTQEPAPKLVLLATVLPLAICQLMLVLVKVPPEVLKVTAEAPPGKITVPMPAPVDVKVPPVWLKFPPISVSYTHLTLPTSDLV